MIKGIDHIAVAVANIDESLAVFDKVFGKQADHRERVESYGTDTASIKLNNTCIELVEGIHGDSAIRKFIDKKGPGIHHIALEVEDIRAVLENLKERGVVLIDESPRAGKDNSLVAFIHPKSTGGVLYELVQPAR